MDVAVGPGVSVGRGVSDGVKVGTGVSGNKGVTVRRGVGTRVTGETDGGSGSSAQSAQPEALRHSTRTASPLRLRATEPDDEKRFTRNDILIDL